MLKRGPGLWSRAVLLLAVGLGMACFWQEEPLRFGVTFEDRSGLEEGGAVLYKGLEIGRVTEVTLDDEGNVLVRVEVEPKYRAAIARDSIIEIERSTGIRGLQGRRQLVVRDGDGEHIRIDDGEVLTGRDIEIEDLLADLSEAARQAWRQSGELARQLGDELEEFADSPRGQELLESLEELGEATEELVKEGYDRLRRSRLPDIRKKAEDLRRELHDRGMEEEAKKFWDQFSRWLEQMENATPTPPEKEKSEHNGEKGGQAP